MKIDGILNNTLHMYRKVCKYMRFNNRKVIFNMGLSFVFPVLNNPGKKHFSKLRSDLKTNYKHPVRLELIQTIIVC